jgi:hypothetical protein
MGRSGTRMDLAMVKQEQGETLRKYMQCFFDKRVGDSPEGPLKNRGESCLKPVKNAKCKTHLEPNTKRAHTARPTPRWPPRPTRAAPQGAPSSKVRLARGLTPPSNEVRLARGLTPPRAGFRLARGSPPPSSGLCLARGSLTSTPAPARVYGI